MLILGVETSCDETAAAVVRDGREVLSSSVASQDDLHARFGGVVPEVACRAHIEVITYTMREAMDGAGVAPCELGAVAAVNGPGLVGALLIGLTAAKTFAWYHKLPLVAVNHVAAHVYAANLLPSALEYPVVGLVASGGHTSLCYARSPADIEFVGATIDDAAGEAFDKVACLLGLGYPGGSAIEKVASRGNPAKIRFPRARLGEKGSLDFSFSGLKTAVLYHVCGQDGGKRGTDVPPVKKDSSDLVKGRSQRDGGAACPLSDQEIADVAASFQEAVVDVLVTKSIAACKRVGCPRLTIGGGVSSNGRLREKLARTAKKEGIRLFVPELKYCTDNAAMVAGLGFHLFGEGRIAPLDVDAVPQLDELAR